MKTIYKYKLGIGKQTIKMPKDAKLLSVQVQNEVICIWAIIDLENNLEDYTFYVIGTGHPLEKDFGKTDNFAFIDTVQMAGGALVWHVFVIGIK